MSAEKNNQCDSKGLRTGLWKRYHQNGNLMWEGFFKRGGRHGLWIEYYSNNTIEFTGYYKNNIRTGIWKWYYFSSTNSGERWFEILYIN